MGKDFHAFLQKESGKRQPTEWEKIFANHITDEGIVTGIYKEHLQLNSKKTNNSVVKIDK